MNTEPTPCPACDAKPGDLHVDGCEVERCAACGLCRVDCDCVHDFPPLAWSGWWPGEREACERGWLVVMVPGQGWQPCPVGTPGAEPDLNRLLAMTRWDPFRATWVDRVPGPSKN